MPDGLIHWTVAVSPTFAPATLNQTAADGSVLEKVVAGVGVALQHAKTAAA